jgi:hypothetical protein
MNGGIEILRLSGSTHIISGQTFDTKGIHDFDHGISGNAAYRPHCAKFKSELIAPSFAQQRAADPYPCIEEQFRPFGG